MWINHYKIFHKFSINVDMFQRISSNGILYSFWKCYCKLFQINSQFQVSKQLRVIEHNHSHRGKIDNIIFIQFFSSRIKKQLNSKRIFSNNFLGGLLRICGLLAIFILAPSVSVFPYKDSTTREECSGLIIRFRH